VGNLSYRSNSGLDCKAYANFQRSLGDRLNGVKGP